MAYKSLFSVLTDETLAGPVLSQAVTLAEQNDAHLEVLCMGVDRSQTGYYYAGANAMILQESIARAQEEAEAVDEAEYDNCGKPICDEQEQAVKAGAISRLRPGETPSKPSIFSAW